MNSKAKLFASLMIVSKCFATPVIIKDEVSYADVLLMPQRSSVGSRGDVSLRTRLTRRIYLNIPVVSSNMDTVTESMMAIAMARYGGIGIIHRFLTPEAQAEMVRKVKRYCAVVIHNPLIIHPENTLQEARELMRSHGVNGLLVVDEQNVLVGILTSRDIRFCPPGKMLVAELMTPQDKLIVGRADISIKEAKEVLITHRIEKLPLINDDGTVAGLITGKDIFNKAEYPHACVDQFGRLLVGAAIGVKDDSLERARLLVEAGVDVLVIDIAHGHSDLVITMLKQIKSEFPDIDVIAGNVATVEGTRDLIEAGADAIKVGVGPGSICITRIATGCGYPQLSAIINCAQEAAKYDIPIIADGGICYSGDITKAIAGGASTVMLGSLLAGTDESPGFPIVKNGRKVKVIRGMASLGANLGRQQKGDKGKNPNEFVAEGVEAIKPYTGAVADIIFQLMGGLCSGLSYCGVHSVEELCGNGVFVQITQSGIRESHPHDVQQV